MLRRFTSLKENETAPPRTPPIKSSASINRAFSALLARRFPERHVSVFPNGRFWAAGFGTVITEDDGLVFTLSPHVWQFKDPSLHPSFAVLKLPPPTKIGRCFVLGSFHARRNFWHWMADLIPRLQMLEQAGFDLHDPDSRIVIPQPVMTFQRETLANLGIAKDRLLYATDDLHVQADELIVPAHPNLEFNTDKLTYRPEELAYIRSVACPGWDLAGLSEDRTVRRLFLSRATGRRCLLNESEVFAALKPLGFELVNPSYLSLREQADLFASADVVAGMHGGAFTNLLYCRPGARVVEIHSPRWIQTFFWDLSENMGLRYSAYCEDRPARLDQGITQRFSGITVDAKAFARHVADFLEGA